MTKNKDVSNPESITAYIQKLDEPLAGLIEAIRQVILQTNPLIGEQIKWNSPSFFYLGAMAPFDPKEYKRDIAVLNLYKKDHALLVFPTGARVVDTSGIFEGNYTDGRRMVKIHDMEDLNAKAPALQTVIKDWLKGVDE